MVLSIRPRTLADDADIVDIINSRPTQMPPWTVEHLRFVLSLREDLVAEDYVGETKGRIVTASTLRENRTPERGSFFGIVTVHRPREGRGIGQQMAGHLLERARINGATRIYTFVPEDWTRSMRFTAQQGFEPTGRAEQLSRLDVATAKLESFREVGERLSESGIEIRTLAQLGADDENVLHRLYELDMEAHRDVPAVEEFQIDPFDTWKRQYVFGHGRSAETCWVAAQGEQFVGLARIERQSQEAAGNAFTGVARDYRGRGIATALKFRTIEWAHRNGVKYFYTGNDTENPMLEINKRLGYELLPKQVELVKRIET